MPPGLVTKSVPLIALLQIEKLLQLCMPLQASAGQPESDSHTDMRVPAGKLQRLAWWHSQKGNNLDNVTSTTRVDEGQRQALGVRTFWRGRAQPRKGHKGVP